MKLIIKKSTLLVLLIIPILLITLLTIIFIAVYSNSLTEKDTDVSVSEELVSCNNSSECQENELCMENALDRVCTKVVCDTSTICPKDTHCNIDPELGTGYCQSGFINVLGASIQRKSETSKVEVQQFLSIALIGIPLLVFVDSKTRFFRNLFTEG